jgi:hypothetical protein
MGRSYRCWFIFVFGTFGPFISQYPGWFIFVFGTFGPFISQYPGSSGKVSTNFELLENLFVV